MILPIRDEFDLDAIARSGQCFRWTRNGDGSFRIPLGEKCLYIRSEGNETFSLDCTDEEFGNTWSAYFDLGEDYSAVRARIDPERDPFLAGAAAASKGIRILRQDLWEVLISFIISQNRSIPAIVRSVEALCSLAGDRREDGRGAVFHTFPPPERIAAMTQKEMDACRLGYRDRYVRSAARAVSSGAFPLDKLETLDDEEAMAALCSLAGVGVKVASCVMLFGLHRLDSFPVDTWIRKVLENEYPDGYPKEEYSPYNGVYQQYMFAYYRNRSDVRAIS